MVWFLLFNLSCEELVIGKDLLLNMLYCSKSMYRGKWYSFLCQKASLQFNKNIYNYIKGSFSVTTCQVRGCYFFLLVSSTIGEFFHPSIYQNQWIFNANRHVYSASELNVFVKLAPLCFSSSYSQSLHYTAISMQQKLKLSSFPLK